MGMTESKPVVLDICCRMGGATVGYQRAGFRVIGVDIEKQDGYPGDEFIQADGLKMLEEVRLMKVLGLGRLPELVHQSWPCQDGNTATMTNRKRGLSDSHEQFIPRARFLSNRLGIPYVIEQPSSSRKGLIRRDLTLCMDAFKGSMPPPWVIKHRSFEFGCWDDIPWPRAPKHRKHEGKVRGWRHGEFFDGPYVAGYGKGGGKATADELRHAMQIDWMTDRFDLCEAIPPAYTEFIGRAFLGAKP